MKKETDEQSAHDEEDTLSLNVPGPEDYPEITIKEQRAKAFISRVNHEPQDNTGATSNEPERVDYAIDPRRSMATHQADHEIYREDEEDEEYVQDQRAWWRLEENGVFKISDLRPEKEDNSIKCRQR